MSTGSVLVGGLLLSLLALLLVLVLLSSLRLLRLGFRLERHYWSGLQRVVIVKRLLLRDYSMRVLWVMVVGLLVVLVFGLVRPFFEPPLSGQRFV